MNELDRELQAAQLNDLGTQLCEAFELLKDNCKLFDVLLTCGLDYGDHMKVKKQRDTIKKWIGGI
jgi:hypothetical protein